MIELINNVHKYIEHHETNITDIDSEEIDIVISGGACKAYYVSIVADYFRYTKRYKISRISCVSSSFVVGSLFFAGVSGDKFNDIYNTYVVPQYKTGKTIQSIYAELIKQLSIDDLYKICSGRLYTTYNELIPTIVGGGFVKHLKSQYDSNDDIIKTWNKTCAIPYLSINSSAYKEDDRYYYDGITPYFFDDTENNGNNVRRILYINISTVDYSFWNAFFPADNHIECLSLKGWKDFVNFLHHQDNTIKNKSSTSLIEYYPQKHFKWYNPNHKNEKTYAYSSTMLFILFKSLFKNWILKYVFYLLIMKIVYRYIIPKSGR